MVACPRCGLAFVANLDPDQVEGWWFEEEEWEAVVRLDGECPDHAHRFEVGA